jgi:multicomponent K+:H+ antiporter subunit A
MTPLLRLVPLAVLPISFLLSFSHLLGAERAPGDGFTAGIISSLGLTLSYLSFGFREAHRRFARVPFERLLWVGLAVAFLASVLPLLYGEPLLGGGELRLEIPLVGELSPSRGLLFDLGIYLSVVGGTMTALDALERAIQ